MKLTGPGGGAIFEGRIGFLPPTRCATSARRSRWWSRRRRNRRRSAKACRGVRELPWVTHSEDALAPGGPRSGTRRRQLPRDTVFRATAPRPSAGSPGPTGSSGEIQHRRCTAVAIEPRAALGRTIRRRPLHAVRGKRRRRAQKERPRRGCSASSPAGCACSPATSAATSARENRAYVELRPGAVGFAQARRPVSSPRLARNRSLRLPGKRPRHRGGARAALRRQLLALRASNLSNIGAALHFAFRRSPRARAWSPAPTTFPRLRSAAAPRSPTRRPTNPYRSSGRPEVTFAIERLIDAAAAELGIDRVALRRKNLVRPRRCPTATRVA